MKSGDGARGMMRRRQTEQDRLLETGIRKGIKYEGFLEKTVINCEDQKT